MANVIMPDGTVIRNVPEGTSPEQLLKMHSAVKARSAKTKYVEPSPESYSPEGVPLYQPSHQADMPAGIKKAERILTDIAGMPIRGAMSLAKPVVGALEFTGLSAPFQKQKTLSDLVAPQEKFGEIRTPSQAVSMIDEGLKEQTGPLSTGASIAGDIAAGFGGVSAAQKALQLAPKVGTAFSQLNPYSKTAIGSAAFGLTTPTGKILGDEGFLGEKAKEAALATGVGLGLHGLGSKVSSLLSPQLERLDKLRAQGFTEKEIQDYVKNATAGQILGGGVNLFEKLLSPAFLGPLKGMRAKGEKTLRQLETERFDAMKTDLRDSRLETQKRANAIQRGIEKSAEAKIETAKTALDSKQRAELAMLQDKQSGFDVAMISKVLEPLKTLKNKEGQNLIENVDLPKDVRGHEAIKHTQQKVSEGYDAAIKDLGNVYTQPDIYSRIVDIINEAKSPASGIGESEAERLSKYITSKFLEPLENTEGLTGERWHQLFKELGQAASKQKTWQEGSVYRNIQQAWGDLAAANDTSGKIKAINQAFRILQPIERASIKGKAAEEAGQFTPKELLPSAIAEAPSENIAARGEALLQPEAQKSLAAMKAEKAALEEKQILENEALKKQNQIIKDIAERNKERVDLAKQKQEINLQEKHDIQKEDLQKTINSMSSTPPSPFTNYVYRATLLSPMAAKAGKSLFDPTTNIIPEALNFITEGFMPLAIAGGPTAANLLYSGIASPLIKRGALAERPSVVKKMGENIREYLKPGIAETVPAAVPGILEANEARKEDQEYAAGGLAHYAAGGHATPAWQRKEGQNPEGGLNAAGRASYHAETGGTLKPPQPEGGKRKDAFCKRMKGMKKKLTSAETAKDPDSRINKSLRAWNC